MAESACLRRSISHPSETSHELSEGNPMCALGESISFGRYMSEPLAWEKWSTFSNNRYLEEAEKSSRPGSVAKMKAYFEAHYRKIDAKKQAALEQENDNSCYVEPEVEDTQNAAPVSSSPAPNPVVAHLTINEIPMSSSSSASSPAASLPYSHSTVNEFLSKDIPDVEPLQSVIATLCDSSSQAKDVQIEEANVVESSSNVDLKECPLDVQVYQCEDAGVNACVAQSSVGIKVKKCKDALGSEIILTTPKREMTIKKEAQKDKLDPRNNLKSEDSSLKSSKKSNMSKLSSSLARLATPKKESSSMISNVKSAKPSLEKNKSTSRMVQMSMNANIDVKLMRKSSPVSHKSGIGKLFTPLGKMIRKSFVHSPAPTPSTSRASTSSVSRHPYTTPQSEARRSRIALEKSFDKSRKLDQKLQSPSVGNVKSPAPSPLTFSPFKFRTEERAAKRREFFEKRLEKEAEKMQLLDKVKPKTHFRKLSQSVNFSNAAVDIRREVLSDKSKIPLARPYLPKGGTKPSSNLARSKCSLPLVSSVCPKPAAGNKRIPVNLPTKMKLHENASPNIL
ncbi:hypothetical protein BVRB_6g147700 [Beta vulgaris subsp. vulgaris]|nr:hypothetical protein BVRB_6g147700 [Beta vulgaris subsp. vulgaris]